MLKINERVDKRVYFTSDWHWNHDPKWPVPIWKMRGYSSKEEHNEAIIDNTNLIVREDDILINTGDLTLNCNEEEFEHLISRIKCKNIYLLWGNHNSPCHRIYRKTINTSPEREEYPVVYKNITYLGHYVEMVVNGQYIILFHYPISVWNYMANGSWHLCGHSHGSFGPSTPTDLKSKILDVGWDVFKCPVSMREVSEIMAKKGIPVVDHHK